MIFTDVKEAFTASIFRFKVSSTLKQEVARSSETLVNIYQDTRRHVLEGNNLHIGNQFTNYRKMVLYYSAEDATKRLKMPCKFTF